MLWVEFTEHGGDTAARDCLRTRMGEHFTILNTQQRGKILAYWCIMITAQKPSSAKDLVTASAKTAAKCMVVLFTIGEPLVLKEVAVVERHLALLAHKAVGMPLQVERGDVVLGDRGVAAPALGGELLKVASLAEGGVVLLVETVVAELLAACGAEEVLRVESLVKGGNAFVQDRALAVTTPEVRRMFNKGTEKN